MEGPGPYLGGIARALGDPRRLSGREAARRRLRALSRLSPWIRSTIVAAALLVVLSVAAALSTPSSQQRHPTDRPPTAPDRTTSPGHVQPHRADLAGADLARARQAAVRFLASYLRFVYGRASAASVAAVSAALRDQLARGGVAVTPAERRRHRTWSRSRWSASGQRPPLPGRWSRTAGSRPTRYG
jgi:hypothetical protein